MPKYHVHLYPIIRVTVRNVEAEDQVAAIKKAEELVGMGQLFAGLPMPHRDVDSMEYADELSGVLVDEDGDTEHQKSTWYDSEYGPM